MRTVLNFFRCVAAVAVLGVLPSRAVTFSGQYYLPVAEFARENGLHVYTENGGKEAIVTGDKNTRLIFNVNSAQAVIDGINVRLSYPVAADHGQLYMAQMDIETAIRPLIFSQRPGAKRITTICIDPGHGGKDSGYHVGGYGFLGHSEKTYTLALALELRRQLMRAGFRVILTRSSDIFIHLPDRPALANRDGADLFISLHFNGYFGSRADEAAIEGPETYCITPVGAPSSNAHGEATEFGSAVGAGPTVANHCEDKSLLLAYQMEKSLVQNLHADDRGVRRARFAVLRDAEMPAILIEGGYITNPVESKKIYSSDYRKQMAAAIVKAIEEYQRLTSVSHVPSLH